jgi:predicted  nucleic acid-binding Zn-ribbon protein
MTELMKKLNEKMTAVTTNLADLTKDFTTHKDFTSKTEKNLRFLEDDVTTFEKKIEEMELNQEKHLELIDRRVKEHVAKTTEKMNEFGSIISQARGTLTTVPAG